MNKDVLDILEKCKSKRRRTIMGVKIYEVDSTNKVFSGLVKIYKNKLSLISGNKVIFESDFDKSEDIVLKLNEILDQRPTKIIENITLEDVKNSLDIATIK